MLNFSSIQKESFDIRSLFIQQLSNNYSTVVERIENIYRMNNYLNRKFNCLEEESFSSGNALEASLYFFLLFYAYIIIHCLP